jgi:hypothetical protein
MQSNFCPVPTGSGISGTLVCFRRYVTSLRYQFRKVKVSTKVMKIYDPRSDCDLSLRRLKARLKYRMGK